MSASGYDSRAWREASVHTKIESIVFDHGIRSYGDFPDGGIECECDEVFDGTIPHAGHVANVLLELVMEPADAWHAGAQAILNYYSDHTKPTMDEDDPACEYVVEQHQMIGATKIRNPYEEQDVD